MLGATGDRRAYAPSLHACRLQSERARDARARVVRGGTCVYDTHTRAILADVIWRSLQHVPGNSDLKKNPQGSP
jgi:hypothetical protein